MEEAINTMDTNDFRKHIPNNELMQEFISQRTSVDWDEEYVKFQSEKDFITENEAQDRQYTGRLSPTVKERIYRLYLKGATPKELGLRFGIFPDRVKAIVF